MSDKEVIKTLLTKANVKFTEERNSITICSNYTNMLGDPERGVHTLFMFSEVGELENCHGYYAEDY